jgi:hypothetical protein
MKQWEIEKARAEGVTLSKFQRPLERLRYRLRHPFKFKALQKQSSKGAFIFVHIPKCAGTSIRESLGYDAGGHRTISGYRTMLSPELYRCCFKFTFVRNPWDRLVSAFFFLKNKDMKSNHRWAKENISEFETFDAFARKWVTRENVWKNSHFRPQFHFICMGSRRPAVDFIGYYENLADDFSLICERLRINTALREENRNALRGRNYKEYYTDETQRIVAEAYAEDIEMLGYSFDNSSLPTQMEARNKRFSDLSNFEAAAPDVSVEIPSPLPRQKFFGV